MTDPAAVPSRGQLRSREGKCERRHDHRCWNIVIYLSLEPPAASLAVFLADSLVQSGYMDIATHAAQHAGDVALQGSF